MGKCFETIEDSVRSFIERQKMFFVATAPLDADGHVNLSPKGLDSFRVLGPNTVAYVDFVGSGVETIAHVKENRRIVIMFCALEGAPKIIRLHGEAEAVEPADGRFAELLDRFPPFDAVRSIILVNCSRISDSCGFGVPQYEFRANRSQLDAWAKRKGEEGVIEYQKEKNAESIDGLGGVSIA